MLTEVLKAEIKELTRITHKHPQTLTNYIYKCYGQIPQQDFSTEFEYNQHKTITDSIILDFLRDYAHFGKDESKRLKQYTPPNNDDELFNCCSPHRLV